MWRVAGWPASWVAGWPASWVAGWPASWAAGWQVQQEAGGGWTALCDRCRRCPIKGGNGRLADYAVRSSSRAGLERFHRRFCHRAEISVYSVLVEAEVVKSLLKLGHVPARRVKRKVSIAESARARIGPTLFQRIRGGRRPLMPELTFALVGPSRPRPRSNVTATAASTRAAASPAPAAARRRRRVAGGLSGGFGSSREPCAALPVPALTVMPSPPPGGCTAAGRVPGVGVAISVAGPRGPRGLNSVAYGLMPRTASVRGVQVPHRQLQPADGQQGAAGDADMVWPHRPVDSTMSVAGM